MNVLYALFAGIGFGAAMFFRKLSMKYLGMGGFIAEVVFEALLAILLVSILFPFQLNKFPQRNLGIIYGASGGIAMGVGVICFFLAIKYGPALTPSVIAPILGAITASLLAIFILGESITAMKLLGAIIACFGLLLFIKG